MIKCSTETDRERRAAKRRRCLEQLSLRVDVAVLALKEAQRRQQEVREGYVKLVPGDEVKALLDRVLG